jgi:hypothetical protein
VHYRYIAWHYGSSALYLAYRWGWRGLPPEAHSGSFINAFKPRSPPTGGGAGEVGDMGCLQLYFGALMRSVKRTLTNQKYLDKFHPHSFLTLSLQLSVAYNEVEKFARVWCNSNPLLSEVSAIKEIFEVENRDDIVWMMELLANKYANENIDRLLYLLSTVKR